MVEQQVANLSFAQICRSGQCFRMREYRKGVFEVIAGNRRLEVSQDGEWCRFDCEQEEFDNFWRDYFGHGLQPVPGTDQSQGYLSGSGCGGWMGHSDSASGFVGNDCDISYFPAEQYYKEPPRCGKHL